MIFGLEQEGGSLIAPMALAHPLHPIDNRSRNKRRNLWVGRCVSSWWPWFPSRSSVLIYGYIYIYIYIYICMYIPYTSSVIGRIYNGSVIQYWRSCTPSRSIGECAVPELNATFCFLWFTNCVLLFDKNLKYLMLVTFGICFKHFDTRYLVFYNTSPPRMFLSLDLLWEYRIQHGTNGPLYVTSSNSTLIFCRGVSGFATDCHCGVWYRGLTTSLLDVGPPFGNRILNNSWAVGLT